MVGLQRYNGPCSCNTLALERFHSVCDDTSNGFLVTGMIRDVPRFHTLICTHDHDDNARSDGVQRYTVERMLMTWWTCDKR